MSISLEHQPPLFDEYRDVPATHPAFDKDWQQGLAHDLRSPLFAILGYLQLIQRYVGPASETKVAEYAALAQEAATRLSQLVDEFLRNEAEGPGWLRIEPHAVDLSELFRNLEHTFSVLAAPKAIRLSFEVPDNCTVWADPKLLSRVFENLIGNAVKFTPPNGHIRVSVRMEGTNFIFNISDTGRGIPREALGRIFDRFHQVHPDDRIQGHGLGLAVARLIVEAHRGSISVQSEVGVGSCFTFCIPAAPGLRRPPFTTALVPLA